MFVYHHVVSELDNLLPEHFYAYFWKEHDLVTGTSGGRNTVYFVNDVFSPSRQPETEWVLRHYYRGGLPGKILKDQFFFTGYERTRALREYRLLQVLADMKLPVPKAIGAHVARAGVTYRSNIIIERVPDSDDIGRLLKHQSLDEKSWFSIGCMIRKFHDVGLSHVDLNCKNILWQHSTQTSWLIDFDRCRIQSPNIKWQTAQIDRLLRSFKKEQRSARESKQTFNWQEENWAQLLEGYYR